MLKKTITYTDYNGLERTEDFYFNLNNAEITEMEFSIDGGLTAFCERVVAAKDQKELIKLFKYLILKSYGEKSDDGKRFIKNDQIREGFSQTEAYNILFMELATNEKAASDFVNGIVPAPNAK